MPAGKSTPEHAHGPRLRARKSATMHKTKMTKRSQSQNRTAPISSSLQRSSRRLGLPLRVSQRYRHRADGVYRSLLHAELLRDAELTPEGTRGRRLIPSVGGGGERNGDFRSLQRTPRCRCEPEYRLCDLPRSSVTGDLCFKSGRIAVHLKVRDHRNRAWDLPALRWHGLRGYVLAPGVQRSRQQNRSRNGSGLEP